MGGLDSPNTTRTVDLKQKKSSGAYLKFFKSMRRYLTERFQCGKNGGEKVRVLNLLIEVKKKIAVVEENLLKNKNLKQEKEEKADKKVRMEKASMKLKQS